MAWRKIGAHYLQRLNEMAVYKKHMPEYFTTPSNSMLAAEYYMDKIKWSNIFFLFLKN